MKFDRQESDIVREDKNKERILYTEEFSNYFLSVVQINAQPPSNSLNFNHQTKLA